MAFEKQYKKFLVRADLLRPSATMDITQYVTSISVKKNYLEHVFPLFVIGFKMPSTVRDIIRDENVEISLSVMSFNYCDTNSMAQEENNAVYADEMLYETILRLYDKPFTSTYSAKDIDTDESAENAPFIEYVVTGIPKDLIERNSDIINEVFSDAKTTSMVANILTTSLAKTGELYFESGDNARRYKSAIVPPLTPVSAIRFIDSVYSLYNNGSCALFMDMNKTYCYNMLSTTREMNKTFIYEHVPNYDTAHTTNITTSFDSETNTMKQVGTKPPIFVDNNRITKDIVGSNATYYSYGESFDIVTRNNSRTSDYYKKRYFWNPHGRMGEETAFNNILADARAIGMSFNGVNPEFFTPDTRIIVNSEFDNIAGNYFITEVGYILTSNDMKEYSAEISMSLKKIN